MNLSDLRDNGSDLEATNGSANLPHSDKRKFRHYLQPCEVTKNPMCLFRVYAIFVANFIQFLRQGVTDIQTLHL